tara:strand:+ start:1178 stop:2071 length:894 start_codon:yes stop_codon:yes gene_type:complete
MGRITKEATNDEYLLLADAYKDAGTSTKAAYRNQYVKMYEALDKREIHTVSEKVIIEAVDDLNISNVNTKSALLNIAVVVRGLPEYELGVKKIINEREKLRSKIVEHTKDKNDEINLPSYNELLDFMNEKYQSKDYKSYMINYLLIHYQTRNQDLDFELVKLKKEMKDKTKNYLWYNVRTKKVIYVRNMYKTAKIYNTLTQEITDTKFITAFKAVKRLQDTDHKDGVFIKNKGSIATYVINYTYQKLGEGRYAKIVINHFKNDLGTLQQISKNRGSSIQTLLNYYDIEFNHKKKESL